MGGAQQVFRLERATVIKVMVSEEHKDVRREEAVLWFFDLQ